LPSKKRKGKVRGGGKHLSPFLSTLRKESGADRCARKGGMDESGPKSSRCQILKRVRKGVEGRGLRKKKCAIME